MNKSLKNIKSIKENDYALCTVVLLSSHILGTSKQQATTHSYCAPKLDGFGFAAVHFHCINPMLLKSYAHSTVLQT
uniref:Ovule protein n=1 Tax=Steinernema glaseri TaxID=37863 RepID=A0A1I7ZUA5_9BILA